MFRVNVIYSNCVGLHNFFFFMMDYGENGIKLFWVEKTQKINNRGAWEVGDDYSGLESK